MTTRRISTAVLVALAAVAVTAFVVTSASARSADAQVHYAKLD